MKTKVLFLFLFGMMVQFNYAQTGTLKGNIKDTENNEVLPFAYITVKDSSKETSTNLDGDFELNLEPGTYTVSIGFVGYETKEIYRVKIDTDHTTVLNSSISPVSIEPEESVAVNNMAGNSETNK